MMFQNTFKNQLIFFRHSATQHLCNENGWIHLSVIDAIHLKSTNMHVPLPFSALTLLIGYQKEHPACKN